LGTSASASPTPSASPSPSGLEAFQELDFTDADRLPCGFESREEAEAALDEIAVEHVTTQYCVVSSTDEDLGCFRERSAATERARQTGQRRLLDVIGTTARLEERPTLEIVTASDPRYQSLAVTCPPEEQETPRCTGNALDQEEVVYLDPSTDPTNPDKVRLGPVVITGENIDRAFAQLSTDTVNQWEVVFELDSAGAASFGEATTRMVSLPPPQNQLAIVVDRQVVSNPVVQGAITGGIGTISGGFTQQSAQDLSTLLNAGSLPVELTQESVRTVSPTLGEESLQQGIAAGAAGLLALLLYLLLYYRMLGVVAWLGMAIWAVLALAIVSLANDVYALTLAGVAGLVISLGVTADSYIVFFERLKDELRTGRSARSVIQPAFQRAFRTIVAADVVTGIAALVLYLTAASSVRGFALTLGVATALDLFVVWFFKRPTVFLLSRNRRLSEMRGFGLRAATAADHAAEPEPGVAP
jgi:protein-export membrane protein SecD